MAMAHVLSAMRELILDVATLPANTDQRVTLYQKKFPLLSQSELEDLAKIPPDRLQTYTGSIFAGARDVLNNNFPMTFALLARIWPTVYNQDFSGWNFARELHLKRPWRGNLTRTLAQSFIEHILLDRPELPEATPELRDLAILEILSIEIRRDRDDLISPKNSLRLKDLVDRSVEEVLTVPCSIPTCARMYAFAANPVEIRYYFFNHDNSLPELLPAGPCWGVGARNAEGFTRWASVTKSVFQFLSATPRTKMFHLAALAEAAIREMPPGSSDEVMFAEFLKLLDELIPRGIVILHPK